MLTKGYDFQIFELLTIDSQTYKGTLLVPALNSSSTGIDMQETERLIILHFEDMRMTCYEELRRISKKRRTHREVIVAGIAAYVLD